MINVLALNKLKEMTSLSHDTGLGEVDRAEICQELLKLTGRKQKPQSKYSDEDKYSIVKYDKIMVHHKQQSFPRTSTQQ